MGHLSVQHGELLVIHVADRCATTTDTAPAGDTTCPMQRLRAYAEFHHLCTARYLHPNGYRHAWPTYGRGPHRRSPDEHDQHRPGRVGRSSRR